MKFFDQWKNKRWLSYTLAACTGILFYLLASHIHVLLIWAHAFFTYTRPVWIGVAIAYVMDPLARLYQRRVLKRIQNETIQRNLAVVFTILSVGIGLVLLMAVLIPQLVSSFVYLVNHLGHYERQLEAWLATLEQGAKGGAPFDIAKITALLRNLMETITGVVPKNVSSIIQTSMFIGRNTVEGVISFILGIYFLLDKKRILHGFAEFFAVLFKKKTYANLAGFWKRCNTIMIRYIVYDLLDGMIIGVANAIFMTVMRMPYVAVISVVVGVTNLAPTFGPIVGGVIGGFILVLVNPWQALWFLIFTIILQTCDGYVLKPKLFGETLGVPSVWILICIIVCGRMFGVPGILLAIPFAAIFDFIWRETLFVRLKNRRRLLDHRQLEVREEQDSQSGENGQGRPNEQDGQNTPNRPEALEIQTEKSSGDELMDKISE